MCIRDSPYTVYQCEIQRWRDRSCFLYGKNAWVYQRRWRILWNGRCTAGYVYLPQDGWSSGTSGDCSRDSDTAMGAEINQKTGSWRYKMLVNKSTESIKKHFFWSDVSWWIWCFVFVVLCSIAERTVKTTCDLWLFFEKTSWPVVTTGNYNRKYQAEVTIGL